MRLRHTLATASLAVLVSVAPFGAALAADTGGTGETADASQSKSTDFSNTQLKQFVTAQNNVQAALKKWDSKIAATDDADKKEALQKKENKALITAVKSSGLDPETYNAIARSAQNDPALTKRIQSYMDPQ